MKIRSNTLKVVRTDEEECVRMRVVDMREIETQTQKPKSCLIVRYILIQGICLLLCLTPELLAYQSLDLPPWGEARKKNKKKLFSHRSVVPQCTQA